MENGEACASLGFKQMAPLHSDAMLAHKGQVSCSQTCQETVPIVGIFFVNANASAT